LRSADWRQRSSLAVPPSGGEGLRLQTIGLRNPERVGGNAKAWAQSEVSKADE